MSSLVVALAKLIRLPNLLIVAFTQWLFNHYLFTDTLHRFGLVNPIDNEVLLSLVCCTVCITAGGNIMNDLVDVRIDQINQKSRNEIGESVSVRTGWVLYLIFTVLGTILAIDLADQTRRTSIYFMLLSPVVMLIAYNYWLKRTFVLGNLIVSLLCSLVILIIPLLAQEALNDLYLLDKRSYYFVWNLTLIFAGFAFLTTLLREIVKDMEDRDGDMVVGMKTFASSAGNHVVKSFMILISLVIIVSIITFSTLWWHHLIAQGKIYFIALIASSLFIMFYLVRASSKADFGRLSTWLKFYIMQGLLYITFWNI